ncbi:hypothetical protein F4818DRAFT_397222 [Hypoxylon cercidicola]|nr:hypothetical protein F4818DRAFT_397222 [Hypoxylon cercidicola]
MALDLPMWDGPHPFKEFARHQNGIMYARLTKAQSNRMQRMLQRLSILGSSKYISNKSLVNETEIWEGLSAYNLHYPGAPVRCWVWISQHILNVPTQQDVADPNFDWNGWENNRINTYRNTFLEADLRIPWMGIVINRIPGEPRYRFIAFMHKHTSPRGQSYSCTVYDRENRTATWYDCWPLDSQTRMNEIVRYWNHIPNGWPDVMKNALRAATHRVIESVEDIETHAHSEFTSLYSQFTMISVLIWHIRNVDILTGTPAAPAPVYPQDDMILSSGMASTGIPSLMGNMLLTLRMNPVANPDLAGNDPRHRNELQRRFAVLNRNMREVVRRVLTALVAGTADAWLVDLLTD